MIFSSQLTDTWVFMNQFFSETIDNYSKFNYKIIDSDVK